MARFKFGRRKKEADDESNISVTSNDTVEDRHLYLRRPSLLSRAEEDPYTHPRPSNGHAEKTPAPSPNLITATTPWKRHKLLNSPFPRYRHAAAAVASEKNDIYFMGGLKDGSVYGDTWRLTPEVAGGSICGLHATPIEVANDNEPPARVGHALVLCGNAYIVYGGDTVDTDYHGNPDDNFYMFNINNCKYTVPLHVLNKPCGRYGHLLGVVLSGTLSLRLYLFGGQLENDAYNDLYYFELTLFKLPKARWELVEPLNLLRPPPVTNHSMSVYKSKIYVFGGVYNNEKVSNDVWCFDTAASKWLQVPTTGDVPLPVNEHLACVVGDKLYVYGGNDFSGVIYDLLYCLNLHLFRWTRLAAECAAQAPGPRCGHSMTYLPKLNKILLMGGDKNDYVHADPANFDTYEAFNGEELGTMVYELDVPTADHLMGSGPRKIAASAGSGVAAGAAGALSRRAPLPLPSEDALTRHRRSISAGLDDYKTPNALHEHLARSLDPRTPVDRTLDTAPDGHDLPVLGRFGDEPGEPLDLREPFVEFPSSSASEAATPAEDARDRYFDHAYRSNGASAEPAPQDTDTAARPRATTSLEKTQLVKLAADVSQLKAAIETEKKAHAAQLQVHAAQLQAAEAERRQAQEALAELKKAHHSELAVQSQKYSVLLGEKDKMIAELRAAVTPEQLAVDETAPAEGRGFTELTKYKLQRLELLNKVAYLEEQNQQLTEQHAAFQPFMDNQVAELATVQNVIKAQEDRIASLTEQVRLEAALKSEIAHWKHQYETLHLEHTNYKALNAEVLVQDGDAAVPRSQVSAHLEKLVSLWLDAPKPAQRDPNAMVAQLQLQMDALMATSQAQHEGATKEVQALEHELHARLAALKTFEKNYADALQSVTNTSKALELTQDEMRTQKITMEKLVKENNELKLFQRAARSNGDAGSTTPDSPDGAFTAAHYDMKVKDLEADLYILRQERDLLNDTVSALKKQLYLAQS